MAVTVLVTIVSAMRPAVVHAIVTATALKDDDFLHPAPASGILVVVAAVDVVHHDLAISVTPPMPAVMRPRHLFNHDYSGRMSLDNDAALLVRVRRPEHTPQHSSRHEPD